MLRSSDSLFVFGYLIKSLTSLFIFLVFIAIFYCILNFRLNCTFYFISFVKVHHLGLQDLIVGQFHLTLIEMFLVFFEYLGLIH